MKKILLVAMAAGAMIPAYADGLNPDFMYNFFPTKISPDGKVIVSYTAEGESSESSLYYTETKETVILPMPVIVGNGNSVSNNGKYIVGSDENDFPVVLVDGEMMNLDSWAPEEFTLIDFHGITADGKRIVGLTDNPKAAGTETPYAPIYIDVNDDGSLGEIQYLPFPAKDWLGMEVQYCSAVWISNDGKTILGQVIDWSGMDLVPIIYTQDEKGEWSYSLPMQAYINPDKLPMPEYPGEFTETPVEAEDYMTPEQIQEYNDAVNEWYGSFSGNYPTPDQFMDEDKAAEYAKAVEEYNEKASAYNEKLWAYTEQKAAIENSSIFLIQNAIVLSADGKSVAMASSKFVESDDPYAWDPYVEIIPTYVLDLETNDLRSVEVVDGEFIEVIPNQILSDGTIVANTSTYSMTLTSYILPKGADKYVVIEDYLAENYPAAGEWMKENLGHEDDLDSTIVAGHVVVSDDWSVLSGGYFDMDLYMYNAYVINPRESGVSEVAADAELVSKKYYDLNGLEVKDPANGIYILRSVYSDGTVKAEKVVAE